MRLLIVLRDLFKRPLIILVVLLVLGGAGFSVIRVFAPHFLSFGAQPGVGSLLLEAKNALSDMRAPATVSPSLMKEHAARYADAVRVAVENIADIDDKNVREASYITTLRRLAGDQQTLRAVRYFSPEDLVETVDAARFANIEMQEHVVQELEKLDEKGVAQINDALACPGCNVVLIVLTTLRKDRIGLYGNERGLTPAIDDFFGDALRFTDVLSPSSWTIPDAVTLHTSLFPYAHGVAYRDYSPVPVVYNTAVKSLAQVLAENGYSTAGFTGGGDYNRHWTGLDRGFDLYLDEATYEEFGITEVLTLGGRLTYAPLRTFAEKIHAWLTERHHNEKFFLFVQGFDTHCPLEPREPYASRYTAGLSSAIDFSVCHWHFGGQEPIVEDGVEYWDTAMGRNGVPEIVRFGPNDVAYMRALYDARVNEVDNRLAPLFAALSEPRFADNTIVILMSEHGETLGEHGSFMRGAAVRGVTLEGALSVPLLVKHPKIHEPIVVADPVQLVDVMPTIMAMVGAEDPQTALREGSVLRFSAFGEDPTNTYLYAGAQFVPSLPNPFYSRVSTADVVRKGGWKLVRETMLKREGYMPDDVTFQLYDVASDPDEIHDLAAQQPDIVAELSAQLDMWTMRYFPSL